MKTIYEQLMTYKNGDCYGFHMPGHKRNEMITGDGLPYGIDITEIDGFDDLHHAGGILEVAQERAARLYHAEESHFLINGSTVGILSALLGSTDKGDRVLVARNCHKSVYHALFMNELRPVYVCPVFQEELQLNGEVRPADIKEQLQEYPDIKVVVIVSPTYDGVVSDIESIAEMVHASGGVLIVDEAHGAHFGFHSYFPKNANQKGADIVIHSTHKTMPALTQTALLHMNGERVKREQIRSYLHMLQSSSPSYILMASIDSCMEFIEQKGEQAFAEYVKELKKLREHLGKLSHIQLIETAHYDRSKVVLSVRNTNTTGVKLYTRLLQTYKLQMEMAAGTYVLAMTSVGDSMEGLARLQKAVTALDAELDIHIAESENQGLKQVKAQVSYLSWEVRKKKDKTFLWEDSLGYIATEYAYLYPPGCPVIVPGERITKEVIDNLTYYKRMGLTIEGLKEDGKIGVWTNG